MEVASDHQLSKDTLESVEEAEIHHALFLEEALILTLVMPANLDIRSGISVCRNDSANRKQQGYRGKFIK